MDRKAISQEIDSRNAMAKKNKMIANVKSVMTDIQSKGSGSISDAESKVFMRDQWNSIAELLEVQVTRPDGKKIAPNTDHIKATLAAEYESWQNLHEALNRKINASG
jgi:hypothetical protein